MTFTIFDAVTICYDGTSFAMCLARNMYKICNKKMYRKLYKSI